MVLKFQLKWVSYSLIKKVDNLIIVGAMANNFIKFKGNKIGKSLIEPGSEKFIKEIYNKAQKIIVNYNTFRFCSFRNIRWKCKL